MCSKSEFKKKRRRKPLNISDAVSKRHADVVWRDLGAEATLNEGEDTIELAVVQVRSCSRWERVKHKTDGQWTASPHQCGGTRFASAACSFNRGFIGLWSPAAAIPRVSAVSIGIVIVITFLSVMVSGKVFVLLCFVLGFFLLLLKPTLVF